MDEALDFKNSETQLLAFRYIARNLQLESGRMSEFIKLQKIVSMSSIGQIGIFLVTN